MARPKRESDELLPISDNDEVSEVSEPLKLDVTELVNAVRGKYAKNKKGFANDITTANNIVLSQEPSDYIVSNELSFWKLLTGIMGVPFGRIVQIAGKPDSGKSTTAMMFMKAAQKQGVLVILWDAENKFSSRRYKESMGGDPSSIIVTTNKNIVEGAQQVVDIIHVTKETNPDQKILVVWDSVGGTLNSSEDEENNDYSKQPGVTAKEVGWAIKRFNQLMERFRNRETGKHSMAVLAINQVYANIGSVGTKQKGGSALEYFSSLILELTRKQALTRVRQGQQKRFGIVSRAKVAKNHLFDGEECIAELDLVVSAAGIALKSDIKGQPDIIEEDD